MPQGRVPPESSLFSRLPQSSGWSRRGSMALFFRLPWQLHSLPGGVLEAFTGSASQKDSGTGKEEPPKWRRPYHHHQGS